MTHKGPIQRLSVIVPCLNEAENIVRFEQELFKELQQFSFEKEYIFIDDGSSDSTYSVLQNLIDQKINCRIVRHSEPRGLGASVIAGISQSTGDALLTLDADLTFHPQQFHLLLSRYTADVSCVCGSPVAGAFQGVSFYRRFLSVTVNRIYSLLLKENISSISSIFRLYKTSTVQRLSLESQGFDINAEIASKLIISGEKVVEVPVVLTDRIFGQSKINSFREIKNHVKLIMKIMMWKAYAYRHRAHS